LLRRPHDGSSSPCWTSTRSRAALSGENIDPG
jgi:hypothetical protein